MTKTQKIHNVKSLTMALASLERVNPEMADVNKAKALVLKAVMQTQVIETGAAK